MGHTLKILHLEDLHSDSELITMQLNKANMQYENLVVDTKTEFISALQQFAPDIILADHSLNSFNSMEALEIVKESNPNIPFLVVTTSASAEFADNIVKQGARGYILKDNLDTLPDAIRDAMEKVYLKVEEYPVNEVVSAEEKLYDLNMLEAMEDNDYLVEILSIFLEETPREFKEMQKAASSGKAPIVADKAHKLKSSSGLLEANKLTRILEQIEYMARSENRPADLLKLVESALPEYKKIETSLKNYLKTIPQH